MSIFLKENRGARGALIAVLGLFLVIIALCAVWLSSSRESIAGNLSIFSEDVAARRAVPIDLSAAFRPAPIVEEGVYIFRSKDTFISALRYLGASQGAISKIVGEMGLKCNLDRVVKGQKMPYQLEEGVGLRQISYPCGPTDILHARIDQAGARLRVEEIPHRTIEKVYACEMKRGLSLIASAAQVGISEKVVMDLAYIYRSEIDFNNDVHAGDQLKVLVNEIQDLDGNTLANGRIIASEMLIAVKADGQYWAIKYEGPEGKGFFDSRGWSLKKSFIKSPLPFLSISSGFTTRRFHPILKKYRAHEGVDFRAPTGTPIMAAADGKVIYAGWLGGYGRVVKINHGNLTTLYAHMSKINVRRGQRVKQGKIIGRVGMSGLATGPHLHYGMYRGGKAINPMGVHMETATVITSEKFIKIRNHAVSRLKSAQPQNK